MDKFPTSRIVPPRSFQRLLRWFCTPELLEELEGDLEEAFEFNRSTRSTRYAKFSYAREVVCLMRPSVIRKLNYNNINSTIMINNYGKVAFRNFIKNKTYVLINILSMSMGLA